MALVLIARLVEPIEGSEGVLALVLGDAGAVVVDVNDEAAAVIRARELYALGVALGVADEIGEAATERRRAAPPSAGVAE